MKIARLLPPLAVALLLGCGARESEEEEFVAATPASLPITLEGDLEITNFEGDREEDGGEGEFGFGVFKSGDDEYLIELDSNLLESAGIGETGKVRATLGAKSEYGEDAYVITSLEKL